MKPETARTETDRKIHQALQRRCFSSEYCFRFVPNIAGGILPNQSLLPLASPTDREGQNKPAGRRVGGSTVTFSVCAGHVLAARLRQLAVVQ